MLLLLYTALWMYLQILYFKQFYFYYTCTSTVYLDVATPTHDQNTYIYINNNTGSYTVQLVPYSVLHPCLSRLIGIRNLAVAVQLLKTAKEQNVNQTMDNGDNIQSLVIILDVSGNRFV
jgi:hypothetical protein